jgi:diguanylate cyclase (GGDEF)-like protein
MNKELTIDNEIQAAVFVNMLEEMPLLKNALKTKLRTIKELQDILDEKEKLLYEKNILIGDLQKKLLEARIDPVTKVLNRANIEDKLDHEISKPGRRKSDKLSVIMLDIDLFKHVNDTYGHNIGDIILNKIAEICLEVAKSKRRTDTFGRWGGEEFLFVLPETDLDGAVIMAERARQLIESYDYYRLKTELSLPVSVPAKVTVSMGVSEQEETTQEPRSSEEIKLIKEKLIGTADRRLYKAKVSGRNIVCFID